MKVAARKFLLFKGHSLLDIYVKRPIDDEICWTEGSKVIVLKSVSRHFYEKSVGLEFQGKSYFVPVDVEKYLESCYGENWRTPIREWNFLTDDHSMKAEV